MAWKFFTNQGAEKHAPGVPDSLIGQELAYAEATTQLSVTATTEGTAQTVVTAPAFTADGVSAYLVKFFAPYANNPAGGSNLFLDLFQNGSAGGWIGVIQGGSSTVFVPVCVARRITPTAGSHTFSIRAHVTNGTGTVTGGPGGAGAAMPAYIRITRAT